MAATFGPACALPTWIQFLRPTAIGRMEFSARLLLSSNYFHRNQRAAACSRPMGFPILLQITLESIRWIVALFCRCTGKHTGLADGAALEPCSRLDLKGPAEPFGLGRDP